MNNIAHVPDNRGALNDGEVAHVLERVDQHSQGETGLFQQTVRLRNLKRLGLIDSTLLH